MTNEELTRWAASRLRLQTDTDCNCGTCAQTRQAADTIERLTAQLAEARQALATIRDGDVPREAAAIYRADGKPSKHDQCEHGVWHYEDCGSCISNFAAQALGEPA